jgi:hypothetical protein
LHESGWAGFWLGDNEGCIDWNPVAQELPIEDRTNAIAFARGASPNSQRHRSNACGTLDLRFCGKEWLKGIVA